MVVKPGYKQTELGVIPVEWGVRSIGQMFRLVNGCAFKPADWKQNGTPIIRIQNLNDPSASFNYSLAPVAERNRIEAGDLLFAWSGTIGTSFGARVWAGPSGVLNQHIFKVHMDQQLITLPFSLLVFARVEDDIAKQAHGFKASFVHVKKSDLVKVSIPLPPIPEQHAIATALSDVDALLGALERLIAKKRDLKQAAMQQLLTGQTRLPGFRGEWEVKTVAELENLKLVKLSRGEVISRKDIESKPGEYPIYSSSIHNDGLFGCYGEFMFNEELITWSVDGGGNFFHRPKHKFSVTNVCGFMRVDTSRISYRFFSAELQLLHSRKSFDYQSKAHPSIVRKEYEVQLPPLPEQIAIANVLSDMDAELAALEQRLAKTRALKQGMMQELLTGRTRLL